MLDEIQSFQSRMVCLLGMGPRLMYGLSEGLGVVKIPAR
jgi:hypothetical protein